MYSPFSLIQIANDEQSCSRPGSSLSSSMVSTSAVIRDCNFFESFVAVRQAPPVLNLRKPTAQSLMV